MPAQTVGRVPMRLMAITNRDTVAAEYQSIGIDRIMIDLERLGKAERQAGRSTWISDHTSDDVSRCRRVLTAGSLVVRINPINPQSRNEIDDIIARGADMVMLPMANTVAEVRRFTDLVGGRVRTCLLVETVGALRHIDDILSDASPDEVHFGLNDLHLELALHSMFSILSEGLLDEAAFRLTECGKPFGIGGVGSLGQGPIDPRLILAEHVRLGSTAVILSRSFFAGIDQNHRSARLAVIEQRVADLRAYLEAARRFPVDVIQENRAALRENICANLTSAEQATTSLLVRGA